MDMDALYMHDTFHFDNYILFHKFGEPGNPWLFKPHKRLNNIQTKHNL